jgi:hypothetical protein
MTSGFLVDGCGRARAALRPAMQQAVAAEYAERLQQATGLELERLRREMAREVRRRVAEKSPWWGLY